MSASGWRLIHGDGGGLEPVPGARNMAVDQALLESVADGAVPALRLYRWSPPTLSFGRNQPARDLYDEAAAVERGIAFVRRPTGGQAVLHHVELTYAVVAPVEEVGKPRSAYRRINEALVAGLRGLGLDASLAEAGSGGGVGAGAGGGAGHDWLSACFRTPARGEVVASGRKLVGSAQRTERRTVLQHGSILLGGSQAPVEDLLLDPPVAVADGGGGSSPSGAAGWTTLEAELGRVPGVGALAGALAAGFEAVLGVALDPVPLARSEAAAARELQQRFAADAWTWRR